MKTSAEPQRMDVLIVADDLTGACDAGVHFAARGMQTQVIVDSGVESVADPQVIAYNTNTRGPEVSLLAERMMPAFALARDWKPRLLMKKLDSTCRGPIGREIALMLDWLQLPLAIATPAFPDTGRVVRGGRVILAEGGSAVDIAGSLAGMNCAHISRAEIEGLGDRVAQALRRGTKVLIVDAEDNEDLSCLVRQNGKVPNVLWAGSGGLARAFATELGGNLREIEPQPRLGPVLICVGSDHRVTAAQIRKIEQRARALQVSAGDSGFEMAKDALSRGLDVLVKFSREQIETAPDIRFADKIGVSQCGSVIATGGDTALYVLRSLGAHSITLRAEIESGIPWGEIVGGAAERKNIVTKSGGFGNSGSLLACVDFFNPIATNGQKAESL